MHLGLGQVHQPLPRQPVQLIGRTPPRHRRRLQRRGVLPRRLRRGPGHLPPGPGLGDAPRVAVPHRDRQAQAHPHPALALFAFVHRADRQVRVLLAHLKLQLPLGDLVARACRLDRGPVCPAHVCHRRLHRIHIPRRGRGAACRGLGVYLQRGPQRHARAGSQPHARQQLQSRPPGGRFQPGVFQLAAGDLQAQQPRLGGRHLPGLDQASGPLDQRRDFPEVVGGGVGRQAGRRPGGPGLRRRPQPVPFHGPHLRAGLAQLGVRGRRRHRPPTRQRQREAQRHAAQPGVGVGVEVAQQLQPQLGVRPTSGVLGGRLRHAQPPPRPAQVGVTQQRHRQHLPPTPARLGFRARGVAEVRRGGRAAGPIGQRLPGPLAVVRRQVQRRGAVGFAARCQRARQQHRRPADAGPSTRPRRVPRCQVVSFHRQASRGDRTGARQRCRGSHFGHTEVARG